MDRLERLVNLAAALLDSERPLTRAELRARLGGYPADDAAFRRGFERDKEALRQIGLPLVAVPRDGDGGEDQVAYRIDREAYELPDPGLSEEELTALRIAAGAVRTGGPWAPEVPRDALRKLAAASPERPGAGPAGGEEPRGPAGRSAGAPELAELAGGPDVAVVFGALAERRRVRFGYRGEQRLVDPWRLSYRSGHWYLAGFDHTRGASGAERLYRLDRVEGTLSATGPAEAFERPAAEASGPIPPWRLGDGPEVEVRVLVDASHAPEAVAVAGEAAVLGHAGGGVELSLQVTSREGLRSFVLGFLEHAEVLDPPEVRDELRSWLQALAGPGDPARPAGSARRGGSAAPAGSARSAGSAAPAGAGRSAGSGAQAGSDGGAR